MPHYKLQYFPLRGRAESIRLLLTYLGQEFIDEKISFEEWPKVKPTTPFGFLPVLTVDGEYQIAQTLAILRYLARKHGLEGSTDEENAYIDMYADQIQDAVVAILPYFISKVRGIGCPKTTWKEYVSSNIRNVTGPIFEKVLKESSSGFLVGSKVSWVDIYAAEFFHRLINAEEEEGLFDTFPE
ncbi:hypothetical protein AB6A40_004964, partial [Gnathostoma spinigerum]